jgi:hypothetical protein
MIHLVQVSDGSSRRVAIVEEPRLRCLTGVQSVYELAQQCLGLGRQLSEQAIALGSAKERQSMHLTDAAKAVETVTDSMRMFQWGIEGGRPAEGEIGIAPEWFYKGNGSMLQAPFAPLTIPACAEDGGEEAELAGI